MNETIDKEENNNKRFVIEIEESDKLVKARCFLLLFSSNDFHKKKKIIFE